MEARVKASQDAIINVPNLERFIRGMQGQLSNLDLEGKRLALGMLGITVYLDGESVKITGTIPIEDSAIVYVSSRRHVHNSTLSFGSKIATGVVKK